MTVTEEYAIQMDERNRLEAELSAVKKRLADLEPDVLKWFEAQGLSSAKLSDGRTIYLRRELWAGRADGVDNEEACSALIASGLTDLVEPHYNVNTLSAYLRELDKNGDPLPPPMQGKIIVREVFKVGSRRPGAKE